MQKSNQQESQQEVKLETFVCAICEQEHEVMHEARYELDGKLTKVGKEEFSEEVHILVCGYCVCKLIEMEGY